MAAPLSNDAHVLHLSVVLFVLSDTYREPERLGVQGHEVAEIPTR